MTPSEDFALKLRYFSERLRKGEKLDACDAAVINAAADRLVEQEVVIVSTQQSMNAAASILGRAR